VAFLEKTSQSGPASAAPRRREWLAVGIAVLLVAALVTATHWPVLKAQALSFDDDAFVAYNPLVGHPGWPSVWQFFREVLQPSTVKGYYLPLSMTSLMVDVALGGSAADLTVFHRTGLVLHALNAVLILLVLYRLFGAVVPAAIAALLFGLHPLTVEPVVWIGERKTLLATFFALAGVLAYLEHLRRGGRGWRFASLAFYVLALLSKPTVVMLPLLLLLLDAWPLRRLRWEAVREKWPYFLLSLGSGIITVLSHQRTATISSMTAVDYLHWPLHAGYLLTFYLAKIVWPTGLTSVYPPPDPFALANPVVALGLATVVSLTIILVLAARRRPGPLVGWLWFVIAIIPTLGLVQYSWVIASDKYVYFPALGFLMLICVGIGAVWDGRCFSRPAFRTTLLIVAILLLAAEARGVRAALRPWSDTLGLFQHMEKLAPKAPPIQNTLGILMMERSAPEQGMRHFLRAVELAPEFHEAHYNLGLSLAAGGKTEEAIEHLRTAVALAPTNANAVYGLGVALRLAGRADEAAREFQRALRLEPRAVSAYVQIGAMLVLRGQADEACAQFRQAIELEPQDADLRFKLGSALVLAGRPQEAARELREAVQLRPDWAGGLNALAWLLATTPDQALRAPEEALQFAQKASKLTGDADPEILDTVAAAQAATGRFAEAARTARRAAGLAVAARADGLARMIQDRARLYERRTDYIEDPAQSAARTR
jgi:tetratricopeptide (TPR) repeat protein